MMQRKSFRMLTHAERAQRNRADREAERGDPFTRADRMLDAFFDPADNNVRSFRECYIEVTGDKKVTGRLENCDRAVFRESLGMSDWASVLGGAINRRMVADYNRGGQYSVWRNLVTTKPNVTDFRTQRHVRFGGYGDLPVVAEGDPFPALTSPADEEATYALSKRGGTESITLEMIRSDDVSAIRKIPKRLGESADRTLAKFVLDFLRSNPVIYDGVDLFHASHGNLGNGALSAVSLYAGRVAMGKQTEPGSNDRLMLEPKFLWVPFDLEETAVNLFRRGTNQDRTYVQNMDVQVVPVWYWTDADDWCLSADPIEVPTVEIGFLDGQENPELFVQDVPTNGSMFANDRLTYKIRHIYGGAAIDYRGIYKSVA